MMLCLALRSDPERVFRRARLQFSVEEIVQKAREALAIGVTELHIVGGLHPSLPFSYYTDMLRALKQLDARLHWRCVGNLDHPGLLPSVALRR